MSLNGEVLNSYNFYIVKIAVIIVPWGNITKETKIFQSIGQRNHSSAEETLKTVYS